MTSCGWLHLNSNVCQDSRTHGSLHLSISPSDKAHTFLWRKTLDSWETEGVFVRSSQTTKRLVYTAHPVSVLQPAVSPSSRLSCRQQNVYTSYFSRLTILGIKAPTVQGRVWRSSSTHSPALHWATLTLSTHLLKHVRRLSACGEEEMRLVTQLKHMAGSRSRLLPRADGDSQGHSGEGQGHSGGWGVKDTEGEEYVQVPKGKEQTTQTQIWWTQWSRDWCRRGSHAGAALKSLEKPGDGEGHDGGTRTCARSWQRRGRGWCSTRPLTPGSSPFHRQVALNAQQWRSHRPVGENREVSEVSY